LSSIVAGAAVAGYLSLGVTDTRVKVTPLRNGQVALTHNETVDDQERGGLLASAEDSSVKRAAGTVTRTGNPQEAEEQRSHKPAENLVAMGGIEPPTRGL
jgi:hypothetical protein